MSGIARRLALGAVIALVSAAAGCGSGGRSASPPTAEGAATTSAPALRGSLRVFAAASLTEAFDDEQATLAAAAPDLAITYNFAGTQSLVTQIRQGAPADVFASADAAHMQTVVAAGLVETPKTFARNKLVIAVQPGNPKHVTGLADLERPGVALVLADASVPAGEYARRAFAKAGLPAPRPVSNELDVKTALAKVTLGEADAAVVYVTDATAVGDRVDAVDIPDDQNVIAAYPIAVLKSAGNRRAAEAFVDEIVTGSGQDALRARGFLPAA